VVKTSPGFTLLELLVVLSLVSLMLLFTLPRIQDNPFLDNTRKVSVWITGTVRTLKQKSVKEHRDYTLHVDINSGRLWVSDESMNAEALLEAERKGYLIPEDFRINKVEFPDRDSATPDRPAIHFSKRGYSDMALIQTEGDAGAPRAFLIEPFLPGVKIYDEQISFSQ
jgi:prepilin-type N-terminal cleavage/methylation domain-containing protein